MGWHRFACNLGSVGARLARETGARHVSQHHDPVRRLRLAGGFDELERISKEDEDRIADEAREREQAERVAFAAELDRYTRDIENALEQLRRALPHVGRDTYRDIDSIRRRLKRIQDRHRPADII